MKLARRSALLLSLVQLAWGCGRGSGTQTAIETTPSSAPSPSRVDSTAAPGTNLVTTPRDRSPAFDLTMEATKTVIAWTKAGEPTPTGGTPGDIGPECWSPRIREFHPLRAYTHRFNLVLVTNRTGLDEAGWYVQVALSSFIPASPGPVDGFLFPDIVVTPTGEISSPDGAQRFQRKLPSSSAPAR